MENGVSLFVLFLCVFAAVLSASIVKVAVAKTWGWFTGHIAWLPEKK